MSMYPGPILEIPETTVEVAQAAFPKGNRYMKMRDELGTIYTDEQFADLYPKVGQPAEAPWRLALVTIVQFAEDLTDREAVDAVRSRIDLKYLLGLELNDSGFDFSVLSEFRTRLLSGGAEERLLNVMLHLFKKRKWLKAGGKQRSDATHIVAAVRSLNQNDYHINLIGPVREDKSWQALDEAAFDRTQFQIDWEAQLVTCPRGKQSRFWQSAKGRRGRDTIQVQFDKSDCFTCADRAHCTRSQKEGRQLRYAAATWWAVKDGVCF